MTCLWSCFHVEAILYANFDRCTEAILCKLFNRNLYSLDLVAQNGFCFFVRGA